MQNDLMFQRPGIFSKPLKNQWFALRHGQSSANVAGIIISDPAVGTTGYGLTDTGQQQVISAMSAQSELNSSTLIYCSDFLRAVNTATIAAQQITSPNITTTPFLRERYFGQWEATDAANYHKVWQDDAIDSDHTNHQVESVSSVAARAASLIEQLEAIYSNELILLVSHGDTLQILECVFRNIPLSNHRELPALETAELRILG